jgi:hypothetical protein
VSTRLCVAVWCIAAICVGGCAVSLTRPDQPSGIDVQHLIDQRLKPTFRSQFPALKLGTSHCPDRLDLSGGKRGYCTMDIGGNAISLRVSYNRDRAEVDLLPAAGIIAKARTEAFVKSEYRQRYGVDVAVGCDGPDIRALPIGSEFTCQLRGVGFRGTPVVLRVVDANGGVFVPRPPGVRSTVSDQEQRYIDVHRKHRQTIVPGAFLAAEIDQFYSTAETITPSARGRVGKASCPPTADLGGANRATCRIRIAGQTVSIRAWLDDQYFHIKPVEALIDTAGVRTETQRSLQAQVDQAGFRRRITVDCGPDRVVRIVPPGRFTCRVNTGESPLTLVVDVLDSSGRYRYTAVSAAP